MQKVKKSVKIKSDLINPRLDIAFGYACKGIIEVYNSQDDSQSTVNAENGSSEILFTRIPLKTTLGISGNLEPLPGKLDVSLTIKLECDNKNIEIITINEQNFSVILQF